MVNRGYHICYSSCPSVHQLSSLTIGLRQTASGPAQTVVTQAAGPQVIVSTQKQPQSQKGLNDQQQGFNNQQLQQKQDDLMTNNIQQQYVICNMLHCLFVKHTLSFYTPTKCDGTKKNKESSNHPTSPHQAQGVIPTRPQEPRSSSWDVALGFFSNHLRRASAVHTLAGHGHCMSYVRLISWLLPNLLHPTSR